MAAASTSSTSSLLPPAPTSDPVRTPVAVILGTAIIANILIAFVLVDLWSRSGLWWRFSTFTYEANALALGYFLWAMIAPAAARARPGLRGAIVLYVVVAGLIWNLFLTGASMGYTPQNILLHVVSPYSSDWTGY